jgi:hypothetical protein
MGPRGKCQIRLGLQFDHGKLQRLRGGLDSLFVFGPEPGGLGHRGAAGGAVDQDGGQGIWFCLGCSSHYRLLESEGTPLGSQIEREGHANAITMVGVGDAWRAHGFPQSHYAALILICQVISASIAKSTLLCCVIELLGSQLSGKLYDRLQLGRFTNCSSC